MATVGGNVVFTSLDNKAFTQFDGFKAVTTLGGKIEMHSLNYVKSFNGFEKLKRAEDGVKFNSVGAAGGSPRYVSDFNASFGLLEYVGGGGIEMNYALGACVPSTVFPNVKTVVGRIYYHTYWGIDVDDCADGFVAPSDVLFPDLESAGSIYFDQFYSMNMTGAFPKLQKVAATIRFGVSIGSVLDTGASPVFGALEAVQSISVGNLGTSQCNPAPAACHLDMAEWFPILKTVPKTISISGSGGITGLGFKSLESVETLTIRSNTRLAMCKTRVDHLLDAVARSASSKVEAGFVKQGC